jgi:TRAP-type C4-dicarboxylate transport system permease small subunit
MSGLLSGYIRAVEAVMKGVRVLIAVILVLSVLLNFANVVLRKFFFHPIVGAEEVMNFLMVAVVFLGAGVVAFDNTHINMEILVDRFPPRIGVVFRAFAQAAAIVVAVALIVLGLPIVQRLQQFNELSQAANVPLWIPQLMVPVGLALLVIGALARLAMLGVPREATNPPEIQA